MRFSYDTEQWLPYPAEVVFAFFADPHNLPLLMPPWQKARIAAESIVSPPGHDKPPGSTAAVAGVGTRLTLTFRPFPYSPVRLSWEAEIAEFAWNEHFRDRQIRGPFAYWNHCHGVQSMARDGVAGTLIADAVEYDLPFGFAGRLGHRLFVRRQIERAFAYRQDQLGRILARVKSESPQLQPE